MSAIADARRVCFFAHHDIDDVVDPYVLHYLGELRSAGFATVLVTTSPLPPAEVAKLDGLCADVIIRENSGLDFGGWADCLARYPRLSAEFLLLCNDSVYGPFWKLRAFIDELTSTPADLYGTVLSVHPSPEPHIIQSWFLLLRPTAYDSPAFREMLEPVPAHLPKQEIIERYEFQLAHRLERAGLRAHAAFDPRTRGPLLAREPANAAYILWRELLERRIVPFLKIALVRDRPIWVRGLDGWLDVARRIDPHVAELARRNLERRLRARRPVPFAALRDLAFALTNHSAHTPFAKPLLVADMDHHARGSAKGRRSAASAGFAVYNAARNLYRAPYKRLYDAVSRQRHTRRV